MKSPKWKFSTAGSGREAICHFPIFPKTKFCPLHKQFNSTSNGLRIIFPNANDFWPNWQLSEEQLLHNSNTSVSVSVRASTRIFGQRFASFIINCSCKINIFGLIVSLINQFDRLLALNRMPYRNDLPLCQRPYVHPL